MLIVYEGLFVFKTFNLVNINFTKTSLRGLKDLERKSWALSQQRIFPFSSLLWSGEVTGKGRCVHLVCRFISFFTDTSHVLWRWTSPLFSFLLYNVIWGYFIPRYIWAFLFLPALPEFFLWRYLWGFFWFFFTLESLKGSHCISQSGCSWWYWQLCCIRELLPNWTTKSAFFPRFCWRFKESVVCAIKFNSWWPQTCKLWGQWIWQLTGLTGKGCAWSMF